MGYNAPSKIQETALPLLLANPLVYFILKMLHNINSNSQTIVRQLTIQLSLYLYFIIYLT